MECLVTHLREAVDGLQSIDADALSDEDLSGLLMDLHTQSARLDAARVELTGVWDARRAWSTDGAKSAAAWLAHRTHQPRGALNGEVRLARRLRTMPATATALAEGDISADHADRLARANRPGLEAAFARDEEMLVGYATELSWADFARAVAYWEQLAAPDDTEADAQAQRDARRAHCSQTLDGTWVLDALLDPIGGAIFNETLSGIEAELFAADWAAAKAHHGDDVTVDRLARTPAQRRADALVEMATRARTAPDHGCRPRPLITVLVDYPTLTGRVCELANGTIIAPGALAGLLSEADIERIVFNGASRVVDVGRRTRFFTGALRRAIQVRDRHCTWPGCDTPAHRCEVDHIVPYTDGGDTTQDNGTLRCPYHHRHGHRRTRADPTAQDPHHPPDDTATG